MNVLFHKLYHVHVYEADYAARVRPVTLLNFLQDAATDHADRLGVSLCQLLPLGLSWVIARYHVCFDHYPLLGATLHVETWPALREGKGSVREFLVRDDGGRVCLRASTSWVLVRLSDMRPVDIASHLPDFPLHPERALDTAFPPIAAADPAELELPFRVRMSDMDINQHVNNAIYAAWALETVPEEILRNWRPAELAIHFRGAAVFGDRILSRSQAVPQQNFPTFLHQLVRDHDGREFTRLFSRWQPANSDED